MKKAGTVVCLAAMVGLWGALPAGAAANRVGGKFGLFGNIGYGIYAMGDVNNDINGTKNFINTMLADPGYSASAPNNLNGGLTYGGGVQYGILDYLAVGVEAGALTASPVKWSTGYTGTLSDYTDPSNPVTKTITTSSANETDMSALEIGPLVRGYLPLGEKLLLNASVGLEYVALSMTVKTSASSDVDGSQTNSSTSNTFSGSTLGGKVTVGGEYFFSDMISLGLDLGYRLAKISEVKDPNGDVKVNRDGSKESIDYSGMIFQGGIRVYF